jgi:glycine/D-amino acid oxidase-like deaminating enzyme
MVATVEEVGAVLRRHAIDADLVKGGQLTVALSRAQLARLRGWLAGEEAAGLGGSGTAELSAADLEARVRIAGALGAGFFPHVARVHPAKLVSGLARAVEELGVRIHEGSGVREIGPGHASTAAGTVRARWIVRATEGYTPSLRRWRRALAPINSSMIVTEPLGETAWQEIGWEGREVISDEAHVYVYLQRTEDGRIAIGGRGVPYRYGSRDDGRGATAASTIASLRDRLERMFPPARGARVAHAWSGVLGVARDWGVSVGVDRRTGLGWAGGYVGEGVAASNLAGRVISALILESGSPLTRLAWVGRRAPRWEPEPLRWVEIRTVYGLYRLADRIEARTGRPALLGRLVDRASGRV